MEAPESPETEKANTPPESPQTGIKTAEKRGATKPEIKGKTAEASNTPRKRMSPCKSNQPETCTSEATSTTAGDSGHDSEEAE